MEGGILFWTIDPLEKEIDVILFVEQPTFQEVRRQVQKPDVKAWPDADLRTVSHIAVLKSNPVHKLLSRNLSMNFTNIEGGVGVAHVYPINSHNALIWSENATVIEVGDLDINSVGELVGFCDNVGDRVGLGVGALGANTVCTRQKNRIEIRMNFIW